MCIEFYLSCEGEGGGGGVFTPLNTPDRQHYNLDME